MRVLDVVVVGGTSPVLRLKTMEQRIERGSI